MNLQSKDYVVLRKVVLRGICTRRQAGGTRTIMDRLRKAGLIEVHLPATHNEYAGEGYARRMINRRTGQLGAHRWKATEEGILLSGTEGYAYRNSGFFDE